ncbi:MAG: DNA alkylation repair protein [Acidobacteriota bacterium]|nr:DNA alkylation repair protein [Acidobacteriota bacterium]
MNTAALVEEIEARVEGMPVRDAQALRALRREYSKRIAAVPARDVVKIAAALIVHRRVPRFIGDELIASRADALRAIDLSQLERLGSGMSGWDEVDCFSCYLSGPAWREGQIKDKAIVEWARSKNRWWRRAALVSTVPLNVKARGGRGDARRTLLICSLLIDERDEMIVKALSWALRALVARDSKAVRQFIEENDVRLPALVRREVRQKLATGRKSPKSSPRKVSN